MKVLSKILLGMCLAAGLHGVNAQENTRIGFVDADRVLRESAPAKAADAKLNAEFSKRDKELQEFAKRLQGIGEKLERDSSVLSESEKVRRQREYVELEKDFQRKQREFREDLNQKRNEEFQLLIEKLRRVVSQIGEQEKYDLIVGDRIFSSPRIDITEKVIRAMATAK